MRDAIMQLAYTDVPNDKSGLVMSLVRVCLVNGLNTLESLVVDLKPFSGNNV